MSHIEIYVDDSIKVEWHNKEHERRVAEFNPHEEHQEESKGDVVVK